MEGRKPPSPVHKDDSLAPLSVLSTKCPFGDLALVSTMAPSTKAILRLLEVKPSGEVYSDRPVTRWGNRDIFPVPPEQRRFTFVSYLSYWVIASMSVTSWAYGGSVVALGLTAAEGIGCSIIGATFVGMFAYLCGHPGASMHVG